MGVFINEQTKSALRRSIIFASALSAVFLSGLGAEESLVIDAASVSASSPRQWVFDGAERVDGSGAPEIALKAGASIQGPAPDLYISFDDDAAVDLAGNWTVEPIGPIVRSASARFGSGSGAFRAPATKLVLQPASAASFVPDVPLGDLSLEFWLKPTRADSGEIVLLWKANRRAGKAWLSQQISCIVLRNKVVFGFLNFFAAPGGKPTSISLQGKTSLVPGAWSHHLVRFDSTTGLLEYLMNGELESIRYATSTEKQSGTVYAPIPGASGRLELGTNYTGLIDEFSVSRTFSEDPSLRRYAPTGGFAESPIFDLGSTNSALLAIDAKARQPGESAVQWSYRFGDSSAGWREGSPDWEPFVPGAPLGDASGAPRGRYIQLKMDLYPDASGERSPAVASISIRYEPDLAPTPPSSVSAVVGDRRVALRWSQVSEADIGGYVVYYGLSSGDYFGSGAAEGSSPVFVAGSATTSLVLNGLKNGALYYFAIASYDGAHPPHIGELSREISARPSRVSP
ncbi:MAG: hypothetical protein KKA67_10130 [Spirochaetes bacterium]|nr:hypothetical protein [Spirochaetota bacterium]MBU1082062.1 hypothetical protein [Spirochaetota bacterium]